MLADNDTDLVTYYDFDGGSLENKATQAANYTAYNLTAAGSASLVYGGSQFLNSMDSSVNEAAYFDARGGYLFNDNLTDNSSAYPSAYGVPELQDNFTISLWFNADEDMPGFSSLLSSRFVDDNTLNNGNKSFQIAESEKHPGRIRWRSVKGRTGTYKKIETDTPYSQHTWHHLVLVKYDNNTGVIYQDNVTINKAGDTEMDTGWEVIKIGVNRRTELPWKGYIDEVKLYKRSLNSDEVCRLYHYHGPLNTGAACP